jgi:hypothetical protein
VSAYSVSSALLRHTGACVQRQPSAFNSTALPAVLPLSSALCAAPAVNCSATLLHPSSTCTANCQTLPALLLGAQPQQQQLQQWLAVPGSLGCCCWEQRQACWRLRLHVLVRCMSLASSSKCEAVQIKTTCWLYPCTACWCTDYLVVCDLCTRLSKAQFMHWPAAIARARY